MYLIMPSSSINTTGRINNSQKTHFFAIQSMKNENILAYFNTPNFFRSWWVIENTIEEICIYILHAPNLAALASAGPNFELPKCYLRRSVPAQNCPRHIAVPVPKHLGDKMAVPKLPAVIVCSSTFRKSEKFFLLSSIRRINSMLTRRPANRGVI